MLGGIDGCCGVGFDGEDGGGGDDLAFELQATVVRLEKGKWKINVDGQRNRIYVVADCANQGSIRRIEDGYDFSHVNPVEYTVDAIVIIDRAVHKCELDILDRSAEFDLAQGCIRDRVAHDGRQGGRDKNSTFCSEVVNDGSRSC